MIEMLTSVCVAAAAMVGQPVQQEPAKIMVEFQLIEVNLDAKWFSAEDDKEAANIALEPGGVINLHSGARARMGGDWQAYFTVGDGASIGVGAWRYMISGPNEDLANGPFSILTSPRVLVLDRQNASISIGQAVQYLVPTEEEGLFRVVTDEPLSEGVAISVTPRLMESGSILLEPLAVELREFVDRADVEGLSISGVGKPVIETTQRQVTALVGAGQTAVMPIGHREFAKRPLLLLVRPSVVTEQPEQNDNAPDDAGARQEGADSPN